MTIRFQADNDLRFGRVKAVKRRDAGIDFRSAQEAGLEGIGDPELLDRAAHEDRVLVSHDRRTMLEHFRAHLAAGKSSPGVLIVSQRAPIGPVAEAIVCLSVLADPFDLRDRAHYLPSLSRHVFVR